MTDEEKQKLALEVSAGVLADPAIAAAIFKRIAKSKLLKAAAKKGGKVGFKFGAKAAAKLGAKLALKGAGFAAKSLTKLSTGPIGVALIAFDVLTLALDLWDPAGYGETLDNAQLDEMRLLYEEGIKTELEKTGTPYPIVMNDVSVVEFDGDLEIVGEENKLLMAKFMNDYFKRNNLKLPDDISPDTIEDEGDEYIDETIDDIVVKENKPATKIKRITDKINARIGMLALKFKMTPRQIKLSITLFIVVIILILALL